MFKVFAISFFLGLLSASYGNDKGIEAARHYCDQSADDAEQKQCLADLGFSEQEQQIATCPNPTPDKESVEWL